MVTRILPLFIFFLMCEDILKVINISLTHAHTQAPLLCDVFRNMGVLC